MPTKIKRAIGYSYFYPNDNYEQIRAEIKRGLDPIYKYFDKIYAVDGRYINYEHPQNYSNDYANKVLSEYPNVVFDKVSPRMQTLKRDRYLEMAGEDKMDWLIVWDTDDIVHPDYQNWNALFRNMQRYSKKFPDYKIFKMKSWIPSSKVWKKAYNSVHSNLWVPYIRIHKNPGEQRYALWCHYWWCPRNVTDEDLIRRKGPLYISDHTIEGVRITTDSLLRGAKQLKTRNRWAWNNICEEQRRLYITQQNINFENSPKMPEWIPNEFDGYWRYDRQGRPRTKICHEDGTPVKGIVRYN